MNIYIIAEIGNTHEGSLGLAKRFIEVAAGCGVDAVKFQTHLFDAESLPDAPNPPYFKDETRKDYFDRTAFTVPEWKELKRFAEADCRVDFISSPFSLEAVDLLEEVGIQTYKIPSGEVSNLPLLEKVAKTGKKILLSSGMSRWDELDEAVKRLGGKANEKLTLLQCTSEYPCPPENAGLNVLAELKKKYGLPVGFSDHTMGVAVPITAVALGAEVIEKHFTLSRSMYGSDAKNSTEPDEFKALVKEIRAAQAALSTPLDKNAKATELSEMKQIFEKSVVTGEEIKKGKKITLQSLALKKPGDGIPSRDLDKVLGKIALKDIPKNTKISWKDLK